MLPPGICTHACAGIHFGALISCWLRRGCAAGFCLDIVAHACVGRPLRCALLLQGKTREADAKELDAYNLGSFEDSNTTEDSNASVYHDATDELNDDADSGAAPPLLSAPSPFHVALCHLLTGRCSLVLIIAATLLTALPCCLLSAAPIHRPLMCSTPLA